MSEDRGHAEITAEEITRAQEIGPPDFLMDEAEGSAAMGELRSLAADNAAAMQGGIAVCGDSPRFRCGDAPGAGCGKPIETVDELYRCADCDMALHKHCALIHFGRHRA